MKAVLFLMLFSFSAFASGVLEFGPAYHTNSKKFEPKLSLAIDTPLIEGGTAYEAWIGTGFRPTGVEDLVWLSTSHDLVLPLITDKFKIKAGVTFRWCNSKDQYLSDVLSDHEVHLKFLADLW